MIRDKILEWLKDKEITSTGEILSNCLKAEINRYNTIRIGKIMKSINWYRYKGKDNGWYYSNKKKMTWDEIILDNDK